MKKLATSALVLVLTTSVFAAPRGTLAFDASKFADKSTTLNGQTVAYRAYEGLVYVARPVDTKYETMNVYVPLAYVEGKAIGTFTAATAPLFFPNGVGGYMPAEAAAPGVDENGNPNSLLVALSKGFVVASPGARGRTTQDATGKVFTGKAPAGIVDLKAAVRYLHFNDAAMAGDANKIISNGTSAGGGLSALVGATGNAKDYEPYLKALGAADAPDDVYAASAYCPITNLENADAAYEWEFAGVTDYKKMLIKMMVDFHVSRTEVAGTLTADQVKTANEVRASFPAYVNGLKLTGTDGKPLTLDADGNGTLKDAVKALVIASAQKALDAGQDLSTATYLTIQNKKVTDVDFGAYTQSITRGKEPLAFDAQDLSNAENSLFGTPSVDARHFTAYGAAHSTVAATTADPAVVKLMNPLAYIGAPGVTTAKFWRIRHGSVDRDTSVAVPALLAAQLRNHGATVDFTVPWGQGHGGDYDLEELFAWALQVVG